MLESEKLRDLRESLDRRDIMHQEIANECIGRSVGYRQMEEGLYQVYLAAAWLTETNEPHNPVSIGMEVTQEAAKRHADRVRNRIATIITMSEKRLAALLSEYHEYLKEKKRKRQAV